MKKLGVIGGLGPMATALFMQMVTEMTEAHVDQEHIEMLIHSCPQIPDRTSFILDHTKADPKPEMIRVGRNLAEQGVDLIAVPCITSNYFYKELTEGIPVPVIHTIRETYRYLLERGIRTAGLMATSGTIESGLFQKAFASSECRLVLPSDDRQKDVMHMIYQNIKAGRPPEMERFFQVASHLQKQWAEVIVLGCTELSLIKRDQAVGAGFLDALDVLAKKAIELCGAEGRAEYQELITI